MLQFKRGSSARIVSAMIVGACLLAASGLGSKSFAATGPDSGKNVPDWGVFQQGVGGLYEATKAAKDNPRPIFVYFYTDWCGYCRQFERELLSQPEVRDYLKSIQAVRINPEAGPAEAQVAQRYRVNSFPSLFVHSAESERVSRVDRVEVIDGNPKMLSAGAFIDVLKRAGAR